MNRRMYRQVIKQSLRPQPWRKMETPDGVLKEWACNKLNSLLAYGMADKVKLPERALKSVEYCCVQGLPTRNIAVMYGVDQRTIERDITAVIDYIIEQCPGKLLMSIRTYPAQWRIDACLHCGSDLYWDEGTGERDSEYVCIMCSRRYDIDLNPTRLEPILA